VSALAQATGVQVWDAAVDQLEQAVQLGSANEKEAAFQTLQNIYNNLAASSQTTPELEAQLVEIQDEVTALFASGRWQQSGTTLAPVVVTAGRGGGVFSTGGLQLGTLTLPWIGVALVAGLAWYVTRSPRGGAMGWR
jgi:hypothetical protein